MLSLRLWSSATSASFLRDVVDAVPRSQGRAPISTPKGLIISNAPLMLAGAAYLVAKLKRDAPEIAERLAAGEFRSVRAAALAAGIVKPPRPLVELRRWWQRASADDRETFRAEIAK